MPATYEPIATTTLGSAASSITFSSISGSYTDLRLVVIGAQATSSTAYWAFQFNSDTATNYSQTSITGDGSNASSNRLTSQPTGYMMYSTTLTQTVSMGTLDIFSYAGSTNKTCLSTFSGDRNGSGAVERLVNLWRNTSAITSIKIFSDAVGNFATGTTATLYGILKA